MVHEFADYLCVFVVDGNRLEAAGRHIMRLLETVKPGDLLELRLTQADGQIGLGQIEVVAKMEVFRKEDDVQPEC